MAGGSRSENLAAHTLREFLGVSSLPNLKEKALGTRLLPAPVSVIHLSYHSDKYEGKIHAGQKKRNQPFLIKSEPGQTVDSN